jgi:Fe-S-cluster containining protein
MFRGLTLEQNEVRKFSRPVKHTYDLIPTHTIYKTKNRIAYPFEAGCEHLQKDNKCKIYEDRPANCQRYECPMLIRYRNKEISYEVALNKIKRIKELKVTSLKVLGYPDKIEAIMKA